MARKEPGYDQRSEAFQKKISAILADVKTHLANEAMKSAKKITSIVDLEQKKAVKDGKIVRQHDPDFLRVQLDAACKVLKFNGLEVEQHEHTGKNGGPILIEADHAKRIREAAAR